MSIVSGPWGRPTTEAAIAAAFDDDTSKGLAGTPGSLGYGVATIEDSILAYSRSIGAAAVPVGETHVADVDTMTPFTLTAGNDAWGAWVQILGSGDTPTRAGMQRFALHRYIVDDVAVLGDKVLTLLQVAVGASGAAALAAGTYTTVLLVPEKGGRQDPYDLQMPAVAVGSKVWARTWANGANSPTLDVQFTLREYEG